MAACTCTILGPYKPNDLAVVEADVEATVTSATDTVLPFVQEGSLYVLISHYA